jgi:pyridoxine 5-phosphate synthase
MTKLSVNINKVATLRNARGGSYPDVLKFAADCERFGANGITVHPRPDERHITTADVYGLKDVVKTEFNIEGYPDERYMRMIQEIRPTQATLVPDPPGVLTSNAGWDTAKEYDFLTKTVSQLKDWGVRTSIFIEPNHFLLEQAQKTGVDRVEFYTGPYAEEFLQNKETAILPYRDAICFAVDLGLGINAGHDLNLENLRWFKENSLKLDEVSIGHAIISDALYLGIENTIQRYLHLLTV